MAKAKKPRRGSVTYVRLPSEHRARITEIVKKRGWPHSIASVTAEMVARGLATEAVKAMV